MYVSQMTVMYYSSFPNEAINVLLRCVSYNVCIIGLYLPPEYILFEKQKKIFHLQTNSQL